MLLCLYLQKKHCLLDVTPHNVDRLNFAQFYPVVVFLKSDCKTTVKDLRTKWAKGSSKNPKKLYEQSLKLDKFYQHLFTGLYTIFILFSYLHLHRFRIISCGYKYINNFYLLKFTHEDLHYSVHLKKHNLL